jgi:hypothetical protein
MDGERLLVSYALSCWQGGSMSVEDFPLSVCQYKDNAIEQTVS